MNLGTLRNKRAALIESAPLDQRCIIVARHVLFVTYFYMCLNIILIAESYVGRYVCSYIPRYVHERREKVPQIFENQNTEEGLTSSLLFVNSRAGAHVFFILATYVLIKHSEHV